MQVPAHIFREYDIRGLVDDEVTPELTPRVGPDTILVSLLAGVSAATLRARFPAASTRSRRGV